MRCVATANPAICNYKSRDFVMRFVSALVGYTFINFHEECSGILHVYTCLPASSVQINPTHLLLLLITLLYQLLL